MASVLERIVAETREAVEARKAAVPLNELCERAQARTQQRDFVASLMQPGVGLMAEVKRGSPSKGLFAPDLSPADLACIYREIGAVAVSVLTSPAFFATDQDLCEAAEALADSGVPLLRKEFHVDPYQVAEAAALGADAYLLIAKTLDAGELTSLSRAGEEFGLTAFVEVTDEAETEMALAAGAAAIGINNRDLHTFEEDLGTTERLRDLIPPSVPVVAASGVRTREDMKRMEACGVNAVLIGEALSSARDPYAKARELLGR
ncbi:MAG: indole-3-glycerol phosphate synthase TrpC [Chloroflexi bacterium]|nr:indole-3-glycerol phosphate synthase TrpC [Chloroflexota bacterium]MYF21709.1 indole-3-glycerol phosphate synthase TrpC [Chloroflexota bacterium]